MSKNKNNDKKFSQLIEEFESIVEWFDSEDVDLDNAVDKFERGMQLADQLKQQLKEVENTIEEIKVDHEKAEK